MPHWVISPTHKKTQNANATMEANNLWAKLERLIWSNTFQNKWRTGHKSLQEDKLHTPIITFYQPNIRRIWQRVNLMPESDGWGLQQNRLWDKPSLKEWVSKDIAISTDAGEIRQKPVIPPWQWRSWNCCRVKQHAFLVARAKAAFRRRHNVKCWELWSGPPSEDEEGVRMRKEPHIKALGWWGLWMRQEICNCIVETWHVLCPETKVKRVKLLHRGCVA